MLTFDAKAQRTLKVFMLSLSVSVSDCALMCVSDSVSMCGYLLFVCESLILRDQTMLTFDVKAQRLLKVSLHFLLSLCESLSVTVSVSVSVSVRDSGCMCVYIPLLSLCLFLSLALVRSLAPALYCRNLFFKHCRF